MLRSKVGAALLIGLLSATTSQADSIAYFLDQSNRLADGINYLKVTISDEREPGVIDFTVEALQPLLDIAGDGFGIQMFGFNVLGGVGAEARHVSALPDKWRAYNGGRMDGFGLFDITMLTRSRGHDDADKTNGKGHEERGNGKGLGHNGGLNLQQPLTFSITGVKLDTIVSYVDLSTGRAPEGFSLFSARVFGLNFGDCGGSEDKKGPDSTCTGSAYFGGTTAVPAPPAVWLLGTAVAGLVVRRVRRARVAATA